MPSGFTSRSPRVITTCWDRMDRTAEKRLATLPAFTEWAVATPDPDWADLICLDAVGEFG